MIVAYDGSEPARRALEHAARLARRGSVVDVVHVIPAQSVSSRLVTVTDEQDRVQKRLLREAGALLARSGVRANLIPAAGDPATEILSAADASEADVIVVGRRRRPRGRRLREPLSTSLSRRTSRDVLIVH
jgi:nucleotide-binding universal stress UspA family protein